jgi:hypothetical protein
MRPQCFDTHTEPRVRSNREKDRDAIVTTSRPVQALPKMKRIAPTRAPSTLCPFRMFFRALYAYSRCVRE